MIFFSFFGFKQNRYLKRLKELSKKITDFSEWSINSKKINRRQFLNRSFLITAGISLAACSDFSVESNNDLPDTSVSTKKIGIVGAGLSGLVAGYELTMSGYDVIILEANNRIGGRVLTVRSPFTDGLFSEAGAARIPPDHNYTLKYADLFGLTLDPFYPDSNYFVNYSNGNRTKISANSFLNDKPWPGSVNRKEYVKIRGGSEKLPLAFSKNLAEKIHLNSPVTFIEQNENGATVHITNGEQFAADYVLVTVPLPVLKKINFSPSLSSEKLEAVNGGYHYTDSTRVFIQFAKRFWESEELNGWAITDWPEEIWHQTIDQPGNKGILLSYLSGSRAKEVDKLSESDRVENVLNRWNNIFPGARDNIEFGFSHSWAQNEWSGSAYASPTSFQKERLFSHILKPEGRIHFAGEHISQYNGWMQGALASGLRATNEVLEAIKANSIS